MTDSEYDVAIIGGGVAGAVAAIELSRLGKRVILHEKENAPHHKVCGDFISAEGVALLKNVGVNFSKLGAVPIYQVRFHGPFRSSGVRLPAPALGLSRLKLDDHLLQLANAAGADVRRGFLVREIRPAGERKLVTVVANDTEIHVPYVIAANGKFDLRAVQKRTGRDSGFVGFKTYLKLRPSQAKRIKETCELFIFKNGYGGIAPVEDGLFNFSFVVERSALKSIGTSWDALAFHIARHNLAASSYLDNSESCLPHLITIPKIPYGFLRSERPRYGLFCVGDQMAVIPSMTGDGTSIAAKTGVAAARAICAGGKDPTLTAIRFQRSMHVQLKAQIKAAYRLHRFFKNPRAFDFATYFVGSVPGAMEYFFRKTRCRINVGDDEPRSPEALL